MTEPKKQTKKAGGRKKASGKKTTKKKVVKKKTVKKTSPTKQENHVEGKGASDSVGSGVSRDTETLYVVAVKANYGGKNYVKGDEVKVPMDDVDTLLETRLVSRTKPV